MPIRFQVEPDFYDHPKCLDMSDAATALWVRAGSYSAAKLKDGFVPDAILARLSQTPEEAAAELVARGLWSRRKGGYVFHEWGARNLTREQVEEKRERDRRRKRTGTMRKPADKNAKPQVKPETLRAESERNPDGIATESERIPGRGLNTTQHNRGVVLCEGSKEPSLPRAERGGRKTGSRIPDDFAVTDAMKQWVVDNTPHIDGWAETEKFIDYWQAKSGKDATKLDWVATWRNWMRNAAERTGRNGRGPELSIVHGSYTPPEPPPHIRDDPDPNVYREWYIADVEAHRRSQQ